MNLYLVRHAEPKTQMEDRERPLSEQGWEDIRKVAAFACNHAHISVNCINHSPKARARQTAEALAECLNPLGGIQEAAGLKPLDNPAIWAEQLAHIDQDTMLVGHLPHMGRLSSLLLTQNDSKAAIEFQAGAMLCLRSDHSGVWSICWMVNPEIL